MTENTIVHHLFLWTGGQKFVGLWLNLENKLYTAEYNFETNGLIGFTLEAPRPDFDFAPFRIKFLLRPTPFTCGNHRYHLCQTVGAESKAELALATHLAKASFITQLKKADVQRLYRL
jgi:hypothetical protein